MVLHGQCTSVPVRIHVRTCNQRIQVFGSETEAQLVQALVQFLVGQFAVSVTVDVLEAVDDVVAVPMARSMNTQQTRTSIGADKPQRQRCT